MKANTSLTKLRVGFLEFQRVKTPYLLGKSIRYH
mgnify:CR=1 FL=1